jgi:hypothetical protein
MQVKNILFTTVFGIAGSVLAFLFNFLLLDRLLIPDPCYYHSHEGGGFFKLFYDITSAEGFHPSPSVFNFVLTIVTGATAGYFFARYLLKHKKEKQAKTMQV